MYKLPTPILLAVALCMALATTFVQAQIQKPTKELKPDQLGPFTAYTNRAAFEAAAGSTGDVDFSEIPVGPDQAYEEITLSGVTFRNVIARNQPPYNWVYRPYVPHNPIRVEFPKGVYAVGVDVSSFYGDPGVYTIALGNGLESSTTSSSNFIGVVSEALLGSITIRFYSACKPAIVFGVASCPGFPYPGTNTEEVLLISRLSYGPV